MSITWDTTPNHGKAETIAQYVMRQVEVKGSCMVDADSTVTLAVAVLDLLGRLAARRDVARIADPWATDEPGGGITPHYDLNEDGETLTLNAEGRRAEQARLEKPPMPQWFVDSMNEAHRIEAEAERQAYLETIAAPHRTPSHNHPYLDQNRNIEDAFNQLAAWCRSSDHQAPKELLTDLLLGIYGYERRDCGVLDPNQIQPVGGRR